MQAFDLWEVVEEDLEPTPLPANPTLAQIKHHSEEKSKKFKAKTSIFSALSEDVFTKILSCETPKQIWDSLRQEYQGNDQTRRMQILNLRREFEIQRMKESDNIKDYADKLKAIVNKIRSLGEELTDRRIVEKVLVSLPERFE